MPKSAVAQVKKVEVNVLIYSANDRGDRGNVGIIRSPVRATILPDRQRRRAGAFSRATSIRRAQPIADRGFGQDVFRLLDVVLDLLHQLPDVHSQVLRVSQIAP